MTRNRASIGGRPRIAENRDLDPRVRRALQQATRRIEEGPEFEEDRLRRRRLRLDPQGALAVDPQRGLVLEVGAAFNQTPAGLELASQGDVGLRTDQTGGSLNAKTLDPVGSAPATYDQVYANATNNTIQSNIARLQQQVTELTEIIKKAGLGGIRVS